MALPFAKNIKETKKLTKIENKLQLSRISVI